MISSQLRFDADENAMDQTLKYYYDGSNVIAEFDPSDTLLRRYIHGTRGIDERAILLEGEGNQLDTFYYMLQELDTVTGLITKNGTLAEAYTYDAYGNVELWGYGRIGDFNRDGNPYDIDDFEDAYPSSPASDPMADFNMDGKVDYYDEIMLPYSRGPETPLYPPITLYTTGIGNPYFFTGRRLHFLETLHGSPDPEDPETNWQIQYNRARHYDPHHGRWLQRDPSGYTDGMNLYEYVRSRPTVGVDPTGHKTVPCVTQGFDGPAVFPSFHDWLTNYDRFNTEIRDQGGFQVFGDHWLSRKGTNLFFRSGSSYSNWLDGTATIKQMKLDIGDSVKKQALGNARRVLKCEKRGDTCIVENLKKPFLESPGGYFGTDWLSTGNITVLSYSVCNIFKKCCVGGRNCTKTQANCHTVFVAHDSFHFGFPGKPFFWHAKLVSHYPRGTDYYGPGCKR